MKRDQIQAAVVDKVKSNGFSGIIYAATGFGKTKTVLDILEDYYNSNESAKFLWVTPSTQLRDVDLPDEVEKWKKEKLAIKFICYASLKKEHDKYDIVVLDECHHVNENKANYLKPLSDKFIGITATRPEEEERLEILNSFADEVFNYELDQAVKDGVVDNYEVIVITLPLDNKKKYIEAGNAKNKFLVTEQQNYEYYDRLFRQSTYNLDKAKKSGKIKEINRWYYSLMRAITRRSSHLYTYRSKVDAAKDLIDNLYAPDDRVLILSQRTHIADEFSEYRYHSNENSDSIDRFKRKEINRLSACKSVDEGANIKDLDSVFIVSASSKKRQMIQRIGRSIRKSDKDKAKIYIMCLENTRDEAWVNNAIEGISNVRYIRYTNLKKNGYIT